MKSLFEDLSTGLQQAIDHEKGAARVSKKTVEAWELGRTHPTGPANRLLTVIENGKEKNLCFVVYD